MLSTGATSLLGVVQLRLALPCDAVQVNWSTRGALGRDVIALCGSWITSLPTRDLRHREVGGHDMAGGPGVGRGPVDVPTTAVAAVPQRPGPRHRSGVRGPRPGQGAGLP